MKRKMGFTLIELLAVIVILSIIALITVPLIFDVIDDTKDKAYINSVLSLANAADVYYTENVYDKEKMKFDANGEANILEELDFTGKKPDSGYVKINKDGNVEVASLFNGVCYIKKYGMDTVEKSDNVKDCKDVNTEYIIEYIKENEHVELTPNYLGKYDYRLYGATVENYVYFNDEVWRIIGIVNDNVKIVRQTPIGTKPWNSNGTNDWESSTLKEYLNGEYYNTIDPLYQSMIQEAKYNVGGINNTDIPAESLYEMENDNSDVPNSKIAIMYPSDYIYSMSKNCTAAPSEYGNDENCKADGTWLYNDGMTEWLLAGHPDNNRTAANVSSGGFFFFYYSGDVHNSYYVRPVLYLKSTVNFVDGEGTKDSPFHLELS